MYQTHLSRYTFNLGFKYDFIGRFPDGTIISPLETYIADCPIRTRLGNVIDPLGGDVWWPYGENADIARAQIFEHTEIIKNTFNEKSKEWQSPARLLQIIPPENIGKHKSSSQDNAEQPDLVKQALGGGWSYDSVVLCYFLAKLAVIQGDLPLAEQYANAIFAIAETPDEKWVRRWQTVFSPIIGASASSRLGTQYL